MFKLCKLTTINPIEKNIKINAKQTSKKKSELAKETANFN
jgi:hypothetical protein